MSFASLTLFACAAPTGGADPADGPEATATTAQPLLDACAGTYTRISADGDGPEGPLTLVLERAHGSCKTGDLHLGGDHTVTVVAAGRPIRGTWFGNSDSFVLCTDEHCFQWQRSTAVSEK